MNQILHQIDSLICTPKNWQSSSITFKSRNGSWFRRGKKWGRIFLRWASLLHKIWVRVNQPFIPFIHCVWGETVLWGTVFIIKTSNRMQYFTILQYKLYSFNIQDDRRTDGLLAKPLKNFQNHLYRQPVLASAVRAVS